MSSYRPSSWPARSNLIKIAAGIVVVIIIVIVMMEAAVIVEAGHRGVVLYFGAVENRVLGEGIHFIIPFAEQVVQLEVRTQKYQADADAASRDLQQVRTVIALNYRIDPGRSDTLYETVGPNYEDRIIAPTIQESVKASVAKFNAEDLITKRETAKEVIAQAIKNTLAANDIWSENVLITNFEFLQAFGNQIEQKVVAFQKYLTEQNTLRSVQVIANQTVVQAQAAAKANVAKANGESQAIEIITSQLRSSPQYLQWQAINKWNGQLPYALGNNGLPFFTPPPAPQSSVTNQVA